jgi:hypothetical protein
MLHWPIKARENTAHYGVGVNSARTHVLVQLGEDVHYPEDDHVQIRVPLTREEALNMIELLQRSIAGLSTEDQQDMSRVPGFDG